MSVHGATRLQRRVLEIYKGTDEEMVRRERAFGPTTCQVGCDHCCYLLNLVSFPEAVVVARHVLADPFQASLLPRLLGKLYDQLPAVANALADRDAYFQQQVPCVFLYEHKCRVYTARPGSCRHYAVVSDPSLCAPTGVHTVQSIDTRDIRFALLEEAIEVSRKEGVPFWVGPFQVILIWALKYAAEGPQALRDAENEDHGVLSLKPWRVRELIALPARTETTTEQD